MANFFNYNTTSLIIKMADSEPVVAEKKVDAKQKKVSDEEELSVEDQELKDQLEMLVARLTGDQADLYLPALEQLKKFIRESTSSMTAVPKPLKFLRPFYPSMTQLEGSWDDANLLKQLYDVLSVLGMTYSQEDGEQYLRESLKYRLLSNVDESIADWGYEYLRHLSLEIGEEIDDRLESSKPKDDLLELSKIIVPYFLKHNAEAEAVDLLLELEEIELLPSFIDKSTYKRVCLYMISCAPLLPPPEDLSFLNTAYTIYLQNNKLPEALSLAIRLDDESLIKSVFDATDDELTQKQLGFILARHNSCFKLENEEVQKCIGNTHLSEYFKYLVGELNLLQPKVPEDIYKSHLETSIYATSSKLESAKQNLAASFVNGFLNAGYGDEKLITKERWVYKTRDEGMLSTVASLGLVNLWDVENGFQALDQYQYNDRKEAKAGAVLGMGVSTSGIRDEMDAAFYLLQEYIQNEEGVSDEVVTSAITGLGIAYSGSQNSSILDLLTPMVSDPNYSLEVQSLSALALGHVFVGTCNGEITDTILQALLEKESSDLTSKWIRFMSLGLGLLYMGKYDQVEDVLEAIDAIEHPISKSLRVLITICAYAGTGNVLEVQELLQMCTSKSAEDDDDDDEEDEEMQQEMVAAAAAAAGANGETPDVAEVLRQIQGGQTSATSKTITSEDVKTETGDDAAANEEEEESKSEEEDNTHQGFAVLGLALICMGEDIGQQMSLRHFEHLMHYGSPLIKMAVPLAMGLVSTSNPEIKVFETLSRYSHDQDLDVAYNAIFAMGLVGAGTNNARLAQLLRQLASYYINDQNGLFISRIAQGLVHLGKGTQTLSPFSIDKQNLSKVSLAGLLTVAVSLLEPTSMILGQHSSFLYYLTPAIKPRMLVTVDEELKPLKVNVRVGLAVDTVGAAGKPKTITGWVTHSTPVLLGHGEKAELEDDEYIALTSSLEGVVILKKNPDFVNVEKS